MGGKCAAAIQSIPLLGLLALAGGELPRSEHLRPLCVRDCHGTSALLRSVRGATRRARGAIAPTEMSMQSNAQYALPSAALRLRGGVSKYYNETAPPRRGGIFEEVKGGIQTDEGQSEWNKGGESARRALHFCWCRQLKVAALGSVLGRPPITLPSLERRFPLGGAGLHVVVQRAPRGAAERGERRRPALADPRMRASAGAPCEFPSRAQAPAGVRALCRRR